MNDSHAEATNQAHWDEVAPIHLKSYGIEDLLNGGSQIDSIQKSELYPISGKDLIHLQCHIGTDTISLALDGANVTGVDFSGESIRIAKDLAARVRSRTGRTFKAEFYQANVLDLKSITSEKYDIVYTSKGVLCWIRDIRVWADTVSYLLRPGGVFYLLESHPILNMFDDTASGLRVKYPYFHQHEPTHWDDDHPDYSDSSYIPKNKTYEWTWSLSDIVNALIKSGLTIELLNEHSRLFYKAHPDMEMDEDGWWFFREFKDKIPLTFSLLATKRG
ncbi:MAG: class I SAM-dependent methyltransferase [Firmicutes bacterium]|nr:class I SAM-dependent methyltransferase [Bacillota bacterium]